MYLVKHIERAQYPLLRQRLLEPRRTIQILLGPRQVGKSTICQQIQRQLPGVQYVSADQPTFRDTQWLQAQWDSARHGTSVLIVDEIQKIPNWSEAVKAFWDQDTAAGTPLKIVLTGSAALGVQQGLTESLAGRFEIIPVPHWSLAEMQAAFGVSLDEYIVFGGYPGAAVFQDEPDRWRSYVLDALIEPAISRDVLALTRVNKPALLRQVFELACLHTTQELSFNKMLGQLQDAGNAVTLRHYLTLLQAAGLVSGLQKYAVAGHRKRGSSPKLIVHNTALQSAITGDLSPLGQRDGDARGRLTESGVAAYLANECSRTNAELFYWRDGNKEVDFVVQKDQQLLAIEVKSSTGPGPLHFAAFQKAFGQATTLLVGPDGIPIEKFLHTPLLSWFNT